MCAVNPFARITQRRFAMLKRVLTFSLCGLFWLPVWSARWPIPYTLAQGKKPSQVLKQMAERQAKVLEKFDDDVREGKAQLYEWESRADSLRQAMAESAAGFKVADWKGDELLALAALYQTAENYPAAVEAFRAYLKEDAKSRKALEAQLGLARALVESEQFAEAEKVLVGMQFVRFPFRDVPQVTAARLALYKDLALAWRDQGQLERAVTQAKEGFHLAAPAVQDRLSEVAQRDRLTLAALFVALNERLGRKKGADEFQKQFITDVLKDHPPMQSFYEAELAAARLIGKPAPELALSRWLGDPSQSLAASRGKVVLLNFWAMWSSSCVGEFPHLVAFQKKFGGKGFEVIGVTRFYGRSDTEEDLSREQEWKSLQNFKNKYHLDYPIAVGRMDDLTNDERYGITGLPAMILIDRRGNVRYIQRGESDSRRLEQRIEKLVNKN
jgi:thiol-disulfide isomerase/thioredoxin